MLLAPSVEVAGIASRTYEKAEQFRADFGLPRAYHSYEEMIGDPEIQAVYIPLPNGLHAEWMIKAARAGKHCLSEKPFASSAREAREVCDAVNREGVLAMEGFMWRLHAQHLAARAAIDAGEIGPVRLVRASFTFRIERLPNVRLVSALAGGGVMDVGCYPISAARFYFGAEPQTVFASGEIHPEHGVDVRAGGILEFAGGRALFDCALDLPFRVALEVTGETGVLQIPKPWQPDPEGSVILVNDEERRFPAQNHYVDEFEVFSRCILEGRRPPYGPEDAVRQMAVIDAVLKSVRSGLPERVDTAAYS